MKIKELINALDQKLKGFVQEAIGECKVGDDSVRNLRNLFERMLRVENLICVLRKLRAKGEEEATRENLVLLIEFFNSRWKAIRRTPKSYMVDPNYFTNKLHIELAEIIAPALGMGVKSFLIPTLTVTKDELTGEDFNDPKFSFGEFILSDDETRVIQVLPRIKHHLFLEHQHGEVKSSVPGSETKDSSSKMKALSPNERERLSAHSQEIKEYAQAISDFCIAEKRSKGSLSIGGLVEQLAMGLQRGSMKGTGSARVAGKEADEAVEKFKEVLKTFNEKQRGQLFRLKNRDQTRTFGYLWMVLNNEAPPKDDYDRCTLGLSGNITAVLKQNEWLYSVYPEKLDEARKLYGEEKYQKETEGLKLLSQKIEQMEKAFAEVVKQKKSALQQRQELLQHSEEEWIVQIAQMLNLILHSTLEERKFLLKAIVNCFNARLREDPIKGYQIFLGNIPYQKIRAFTLGGTLRQAFINLMGYECLIPYIQNLGNLLDILRGEVARVDDYGKFFQQVPAEKLKSIIRGWDDVLQVCSILKDHSLKFLKILDPEHLFCCALEVFNHHSLFGDPLDVVCDRLKVLCDQMSLANKILFVKWLGRDCLLILMKANKINDLLELLVQGMKANHGLYMDYSGRRKIHFECFSELKPAVWNEDNHKIYDYFFLNAIHEKSKLVEKERLSLINSLLKQDDPVQFLIYLEKIAKYQKSVASHDWDQGFGDRRQFFNFQSS